MGLVLFDDDLRTRSSFSGEASDLYLAEADDAIFSSVNSEVTAEVRTWAGNLGRTDLTDDDFAVVYLLATETLNAKALTW